MPSSIEDDLREHFGDRLQELLADHADTMNRGGVSGDHIMASLIGAMMVETATGMVHLGYSEAVYLDACRTAYVAAKRAHGLKKRAARKTG